MAGEDDDERASPEEAKDAVTGDGPERVSSSASSAPEGSAKSPAAGTPSTAKKRGDVGSFALALAVCALCLALGERRYRKSPLPEAIAKTDTYTTKIADYTRRGGADVVIVGSSRIYHGANAPLLSELASNALGKPTTVYNLGVPAGDLPGYVLSVDDVLRSGLKKPRLFVFGMSPIEWTCCPATSVPSSPKWIAAVRPRHAWTLFASASDPEEAFTDLTLGLFQSFGARTHVLASVLRDTPPQGVANPGDLGWASFGWAVSPSVQASRAEGRANAYRPNFYPPKHFDRAGSDRYFRAALARLEGAGVSVAVVGTPQARQLDINNDAASYYGEYVAYLTAQAEAHGTTFVNYNDFPGLTNADFGDGDHLLVGGSIKFSRLLSEEVIVPHLSGKKPQARR